MKMKNKKEKTDKQKKKLIGRVRNCVLIFGLLASWVLFSTYYSHYEDLFMSEVVRLRERSNFIVSESEKELTTTESFIYDYHMSSGTIFPVALGLYDSDGRLVHSSGNICRFEYGDELKYCYVDEYLSAEQQEKIDELNEKFDTVYFENFEFYEKNGEVVPVSADICAKEYGTFSNGEKNTYSQKLYFTEYDGETKLCENSVGIFLNGILSAYGDSNEEYYKKLIERVRGDNVKKSVYALTTEYEFEEEDFGGVGETEDHFAEYYYHIKIQDESYYVVFAMGYSPFARAFEDLNFSSGILYLWLFCLLLFNIVERFLSQYYDKTKKLEENKTAFTSAAAHELKTPIAIIQNQCECIMENVAPEKNGEYINSIYEETQKMSGLVSELLQYNRLAQAENIPREDYDVGILIQKAVDEYKNLFELHSKNVTVELEDTPTVNCNPELISLVIGNFLSNTVKHSPDGGDVKIKLKRVRESSVKVTVFNTGDHIPDSVGSSVWNILYKGDSSRTDRTDSGGIGLAISARILDLHGAYYDYKNVKDGVTFCFII